MDLRPAAAVAFPVSPLFRRIDSGLIIIELLADPTEVTAEVCLAAAEREPLVQRCRAAISLAYAIRGRAGETLAVAEITATYHLRSLWSQPQERTAQGALVALVTEELRWAVGAARNAGRVMVAAAPAAVAEPPGLPPPPQAPPPRQGELRFLPGSAFATEAGIASMLAAITAQRRQRVGAPAAGTAANS